MWKGRHYVNVARMEIKIARQKVAGNRVDIHRIVSLEKYRRIRMLPNKENLDKILKQLQVIMRLQDWDIDIEIVNNREMDSIAKQNDYIPGGYNQRNRYYKTTTISINKDWDEVNEEWYMVLVHELHHVQMDEIDLFFDDFVLSKASEEQKHEMEIGYNFEKEKLNCRLTRAFINAYPADNFKELMTE
jgi:hypothetical protein